MNFGFKTHKCKPQEEDLFNFVNILLEIIQHVTFKAIRNQFQYRLRDDIRTIKSSGKAYIPADKSRNFYEIDNASHDKLCIETLRTKKNTKKLIFRLTNESTRKLN